MCEIIDSLLLHIVLYVFLCISCEVEVLILIYLFFSIRIVYFCSVVQFNDQYVFNLTLFLVGCCLEKNNIEIGLCVLYCKANLWLRFVYVLRVDSRKCLFHVGAKKNYSLNILSDLNVWIQKLHFLNVWTNSFALIIPKDCLTSKYT